MAVWGVGVSAHESISRFVQDAYVLPAVQRGDRQVTIRVFDLWRGLEGALSLAEIHDVLASKKFRDLLSLNLASRESPSWDLPSQYTFLLEPSRADSSPPANPSPGSPPKSEHGSALLSLPILSFDLE